MTKNDDFHKILIDENATVLDALNILDETAKGVLFIVEDGKLKAAVSDGDIRRWLLKQGKLTDSVFKAANHNPKALKEESHQNAHQYMMKNHFAAVPIVDAEETIIDVEFLYEEDSQKDGMLNIPVVLMAGGQGTRLYPYTKILPKPLIPIGDIPISEHIINRFYRNGCDDFYLILNYKKNMIKAYYNDIDKNYKVNYIDEETPLGTGGGVRLLKGKITSTFILTNCDTIINEDFSKILKMHREKNNLVTMVCSLRNYEIPYGVVEIGENGAIKSMKEKPNMSFFTNTGTYIVEPSVIDMIEANKYIGFPDVLQNLMDKGESVGVYPISENSWLDMGQFDTMEDMKEKLHIKG